MKNIWKKYGRLVFSLGFMIILVFIDTEKKNNYPDVPFISGANYSSSEGKVNSKGQYVISPKKKNKGADTKDNSLRSV